MFDWIRRKVCEMVILGFEDAVTELQTKLSEEGVSGEDNPVERVRKLLQTPAAALAPAPSETPKPARNGRGKVHA